MRKFVTLFLAFFFAVSVIVPSRARAEMPAKAKAFLTIVGYGTAGGALLGAASMAFGNSTRAMAQGASLGLYAGIIFGSYVLLSHHNKRYGKYEDKASPYQESNDIYSDEYDSEGGGGEGDEGPQGEGFFERMQTIQTKFSPEKRGGHMPPLYLNFFQYTF